MTVIIPGFEGNCRENALWENYSQKVSYRVPAILEPAGIDDIARLIRAAENQRKKVRVTGSGWSFEDICHSDHWMVDLGPKLKNKLDSITGVSDILHDRHVTRVASGPLAGARIPTGNIAHVEAGIKLLDLNRLLDTLQRALPTMGGSQGQQLAGAFSTSTHGSDFGHGPLADYVLAVHLVTSGGQQVWIESASRPVTSGDDALRRALPSADTLIIRDDEALNAVTVGLGRFGVIYSVILEVVPEHELLEWTSKRNVDEMMGLLRMGAGQADPLAPLISSMAAGPRPGSVRDLRRKSHLKYIDITLSSRPAEEGWVRRRWVRNGTLARPVMAENANWPNPTAWAKVPIIAPAIIAGSMSTLAGSAGVVAGLLTGMFPPAAPIAAAWAASIAARTTELSVQPIRGGVYYTGDALADAINTIVGAATGMPWPFEDQSSFVYNELGIDSLISEITKALLSSGFPETTSATPDGTRGRSWNVSAGSSASSGAPDYRVDSMEFVFTMADSRFADFLDYVRANSEAFVQTGYIAIRFTKSAQALLSMHNFGGGRAVSIEITSLRGVRDNAAWFRLLQEKAFSMGGRLHWGQLNEEHALHTGTGYQTNLVRWKEQLVRIAGSSGAFSNNYTRQRNLEPSGIVREVTHVRRIGGRITHLANPESYWREVAVETAKTQTDARHLIYALAQGDGLLQLSIKRRLRCEGNLLERLPNTVLAVNITGRLAAERSGGARPLSNDRQVTAVGRSLADGRIAFLRNPRECWEVPFSQAFEEIRSGAARYYVRGPLTEQVFLSAEHVLTTRNDEADDPLIAAFPDMPISRINLPRERILPLPRG